MRDAVFKTCPKPIFPMVGGPFGGAEGSPGGAGGPCHSVLDPFVFDDLADPSDSFWSFSWAPPWDPPEAQTHIFPTYFNDFSADQGPKMDPPGPPADFATPPRGAHETPLKSVIAPLGPKRPPWVTERPPFFNVWPLNSGPGSRLTLLPHVPCNIDTLGANVAVAQVSSTFFFIKKLT